MTTTDQINELISKWQNESGDSHPYGLTTDQLVELARITLGIPKEQHEWGPGDEIPDHITEVQGAGLIFRRDPDATAGVWTNSGTQTGGGMWITAVSDEELLSQFGPITPNTPAESDTPTESKSFNDDSHATGVHLMMTTIAVLDRIEDLFRKIVIPKAGVGDGKRCTSAANSAGRLKNELREFLMELNEEPRS